MRTTYRQAAEKAREITGRAPKFNVNYFTRREVKRAIENNKYFSHACVELGLMKKGSKSPFNSIRNLQTLINHYNLKHIKLGSKVKDEKEVKCPHCNRNFKIK